MHVGTDSNTNGSILDSALEGLPSLMLMAEDFLQLYKVL